MPDFPSSEIVSDILSRLPVKSLLRFRSASKSYCSLIDGPYFIKSHLDRSVQTTSRRSLILRSSKLYSIDIESLNQAIELDHPLKSPEFGTEVLGSCNGLLCLSNDLEMDEDTVLWNMSTRKFHKVPVTDIEYPDYFTGCQCIAYGLGYDSTTDDYKLVRIIQFLGPNFDFFDSEVKVYSLRSNSWRRIADFPYYLPPNRIWGKFVGGSLHWIVTRRAETDTENLIAAVDLGVEGYREVPKPKGLRGGSHMNLCVFEGMLCICNYYRDFFNVCVDVWVMKDYGVKESWTKLLSIGQIEVVRSFRFPLPLVRSGNRVLLNQDGQKLIWYDLETGRIKRVKVRGVPTFMNKIDMGELEIYQSSLVRTGGPEQRRKRKKKNKKKRNNIEPDGVKVVLNNSMEVVADILSRLPVKTLLRLKCVSKPWCTLIDGSDFIKRHLKTSIEGSTNLSLILADSFIYSVDFDSFDKGVELNHPCKTPSSQIHVLGSCNGLLCLYNSEEEIIMWNPSTRKYQDLPITPIKYPDHSTFTPFIIYGFGYDLTSDDYKVVRVVHFLGEIGDTFVNEVKVYSLKTNSWRKIQDFPYYLCYDHEWGVFASGALHWVGTRRPDSGTSALIAAFDLGSEKYREVPVPNNLENTFHMNLAVLGGNLCIISNYHSIRIDIWIMKDYGVKKSWTRLCSVTRSRVIESLQYVKPLVYSNSGNEVLIECNNRKLLWYDLIGNKVRKVEVPGTSPYTFDAGICVGSLVPLGVHDGTAGKQQKAKSKKGKKRDDFLSQGFKLVL